MQRIYSLLFIIAFSSIVYSQFGESNFKTYKIFSNKNIINLKDTFSINLKVSSICDNNKIVKYYTFVFGIDSITGNWSVLNNSSNTCNQYQMLKPILPELYTFWSKKNPQIKNYNNVEFFVKKPRKFYVIYNGNINNSTY